MPLLPRAAALLVVLALLLPAALSACPLCKDATSDAETPGGSASLGRGFFYSILLMIATPWIAVGTVGFLIFRRRRRERTGTGSPAPVVPLPLHSRGARS